MCGRFTQTKSRKEVIEELGGIELPPLFHGRYNIAPTQKVAAIRQNEPTCAEECIWGFENPRADAPIINARSETLAERPMFKNLLRANRCLIPADGFYEWKGRQPYYFQLAGRVEALQSRIFAFAGLWRNDRCVILTRAADENMQNIHHRMPVILESGQWKEWLTPPSDIKSRLTIVNLDLTCPPPTLAVRPVSRRVNKVANNDPACIEQAAVQSDLFPAASSAPPSIPPSTRPGN